MLSDIVDNVISLKIDEIEEYCFPLDSIFGLEIIENEIKYDFIINFSKNSDKLICFGSGAWPRNSKTSNGDLIKPPFLDRWSWYGYFDESCIAYADPSFFQDDKIRLGWYVGGKDWYLRIISNIIKKLCHNQKISHDNIIFFGSSGGGFSSIGLATLINGSKAIVNNSSFSIKDISEGHYNDLLDFLKKEFDNRDINNILFEISHRTSLISLFNKMEYVPEITYFVNSNSERDMYERCIPFVNELIKLPFFQNELVIHYYSDDNDLWGGHGPIDTNTIVNFIRLYSKLHLGEKKVI